ncbi:class I SAM-dependent methyltransferase [Methylobacterium nodulans]|nr:class I SAM-dependent methyltransferase [Methylobacterium nodulans]
MRQIYETDLYSNRNPTWHEEDAPWKASHIEKIIHRNQLSFKNICEVGCGTGDILLNLSNAFPGVDLCGFEIAPQAYARAKAKERDPVRFFLKDFLQDSEDHYDIILLIDVIEHVEDYNAFLKAIKSRSQYKIFHVPLDLSVQSLLRGWPIMNLRANVGHLHYFYKDSILATLKDCGYRIIDHHYTASRLELPNQAVTSRLMRLPRRLCYAANRDLAVRVLGGYSLMILAS